VKLRKGEARPQEPRAPGPMRQGMELHSEQARGLSCISHIILRQFPRWPRAAVRGCDFLRGAASHRMSRGARDGGGWRLLRLGCPIHQIRVTAATGNPGPQEGGDPNARHPSFSGWSCCCSAGCSSRPAKTRHQKAASETRGRNGTSVAQFPTRRPRGICEMPRYRVVLRGLRLLAGGDRTGRPG
jgi:hypothetical protein